jgi:hypothetical protein
MIKGKYDTILDIIMDIAGSAMAALLAIILVVPEPRDRTLLPDER